MVHPLGRGGTSTVWLAVQEPIGRTVALKLLPLVAGDERAWRRFERECQAGGRLSHHPHVVTVHTAGRLPDGTGYLAMEYLDGGSLADVVRQHGPLTTPRLVAVGAAVADALAAAHAEGILHRDVKPENVLLDRAGVPKLGDFGIARLLEHPSTTATIAYTPEHVAPEILHGAPASTASDVYCLGSTLATAALGRPPYGGDGGSAVIGRKVAGERPELTGIADDRVRAVLAAALATDPAARPSAAELADRFARWPATSSSTPTRVAPAPLAVHPLVAGRERRRGVVAGLLALAAVVVGIVAAVAVLGRDDTSSPSTVPPGASTAASSAPSAPSAPSAATTPAPTPAPPTAPTTAPTATRPASTGAPSTAGTTRPAPATAAPSTAAPTTTANVARPAADPAAVTVATRYADALAAHDWAAARALNPGLADDATLDQGYRYLQGQVIADATTDPRGGLRLLVLAREVPPAGEQTSAWCFHWRVDTAAGTVAAADGARLQTWPGRLGPDAVAVVAACRTRDLR